MNPNNDPKDTSLINVDPSLITPVYVKTTEGDYWPDDSVFYILAKGGLRRCRNQEFFTSCVPVNEGPSALAEQDIFLELAYPEFPRRLLEIAVGFFTVVNDIHGAEATMLMLWDRHGRRYKLLVPEQKSVVSHNWSGNILPIGVHYEEPLNLPANHYILGDIHSHCDSKAYSSYIDQMDEAYKTGLHIVVGHLGQEPPDFHVEAVVDGVRFRVKPEAVLEGYRHRRRFARKEWMNRVKVEISSSLNSSSNKQQYSSGSTLNRTY